MDAFGPVGYIREQCENYFSVFLLLKIIKDLIIRIVRHMEINRMTGDSFGLCRTLLNSSNKIFITLLMTSIYNPRATGLISARPKKMDLRVNIELIRK